MSIDEIVAILYLKSVSFRSRDVMTMIKPSKKTPTTCETGTVYAPPLAIEHMYEDGNAPFPHRYAPKEKRIVGTR